MRKFLFAKIHRATITEANLDYEGSITLPRQLIEVSGIREHEAVWIWNVSNGARFETYVIAGSDSSEARQRDAICVNGAAARLVEPGQIIIIAAFSYLTPSEISLHQPVVVFVDDRNRVKRVGEERAFRSHL